MKNKGFASKWLWGTFLILIAAALIANQVRGFTSVGIGTVIVAILAGAVIVQCIIGLTFAPLPIPIAVLYFLFAEKLGFHELNFWWLMLAAVLVSIGLTVLLPKKHNWFDHREHRHHFNDTGVDDDNNSVISTNLGHISRYLHAECLETVVLNCNLGAMEIYFDTATLSPNGAVVDLSCSFGSIELMIPRDWNVTDNVSCTLVRLKWPNGVNFRQRTRRI